MAMPGTLSNIERGAGWGVGVSEDQRGPGFIADKSSAFCAAAIPGSASRSSLSHRCNNVISRFLILLATL